jgi:rhodanese-related sulfurtransferase
MTVPATNCGFDAISPVQAKALLDEGRAVLIDIRAPDEYAREHISGARLAPLDAIDARDFERDQRDGKAAIFQCQSGRRTSLNRERLIALGFSTNYVIDGGLNAWRDAGLPVHHG